MNTVLRILNMAILVTSTLVPAVGFAMAKPIPQDPLAQARQQIEVLYLEVLDRPSDPGGLEGWTNHLNSGASLQDIRNAFAYSLESDLKIRELYRTILNREADEQGLQDHKNFLRFSGNTFATVRNSFYSSAEYRAIQAAATATRCEITVNDCPNHPEVQGTFKDDYNSASSNPAVCQTRAQDYYNWCGSKGGVKVRYFFGNFPIIESFAPAYGSYQ